MPPAGHSWGDSLRGPPLLLGVSCHDKLFRLYATSHVAQLSKIESRIASDQKTSLPMLISANVSALWTALAVDRLWQSSYPYASFLEGRPKFKVAGTRESDESDLTLEQQQHLSGYPQTARLLACIASWSIVLDVRVRNKSIPEPVAAFSTSEFCRLLLVHVGRRATRSDCSGVSQIMIILPAPASLVAALPSHVMPLVPWHGRAARSSGFTGILTSSSNWVSL